MSIKALQEYTRVAKYARFKPELERRETWSEEVDRVFDMHEKKLGTEVVDKFRSDFEFAKKMVLKKRVLGSQRALQFGGDPILRRNERIYNCTLSYCDRPRFFQENIYLLLCGCGCGFSVQKHHVAKLPEIKSPHLGVKDYVIPDSIEGWSDALGILLASYFDTDSTEFDEYRGYVVNFDYSLIRPEGSQISSGGKAPGPDGLRRALEKIKKLMDKCCIRGTKLRPIDAYDICMHSSDAVLSGGIRRSASIAIFSHDDEEMAKSKTGAWRMENPQRGRSNNSALLIRDKVTKEEFEKLMYSVKEYGEPGFLWADDLEALFNPCVEVGAFAYVDLNDKLTKKMLEKDEELNKRIIAEKKTRGLDSLISGWQFCNLCEINMKKCKTQEDFLEACRAGAIIGTIQASYDRFSYLGAATELIVQREALLGVSMTGMADSPEIAFDENIQKLGAETILEVNSKIASKIGINICARGTCLKPAGSSSCLLGTASGVHPHHADRYFRRVQANKLEVPFQYFELYNPLAVEESVWSANNTDMIITFLCEVPYGAKTKNKMGALELLNNVKLTQQNWVEFGTRKEQGIRPWVRHNVSNTITVNTGDWDEVSDYIYENRKWFAGISLLPESGDKDYPQAPFTAVLTENEIVKKYGAGSLLASGLIVDGHRCFKNNLWAASDCVLGTGEPLNLAQFRARLERDFEHNGINWIQQNITPNSSDEELLNWLQNNVVNYDEKLDWIRRAKQFANRYFEGNIKKMTYCLKDVYNLKNWCDLSREYKEIDWTNCKETEQGDLDLGAGAACSGGACELGELGLSMAANLADK